MLGCPCTVAANSCEHSGVKEDNNSAGHLNAVYSCCSVRCLRPHNFPGSGMRTHAEEKKKKGASWNQRQRELIGRPAARQSQPITSLRCHWWTSGNGTASSIRSTIVACKTPAGAAGLLAADWSATGHNADSDLERRSAGILT